MGVIRRNILDKLQGHKLSTCP